MSDVVLVIGDPLMPGEQLAAPARELLADRFAIRVVDWELTFEEAVTANLRIEHNGPNAVPTQLKADPSDDDVVGVLTQFFPLSADTLTRWPRLRAVATLRAGTENIDLDALAERGVNFTANAGRNANAVAELAIALMLSTLRSVGENHHSVRSGRWRAPHPPVGHRELAGRRLGIIGFGAVGRLVAHRLSGFDLDIATHDPFTTPRPGDPAQLELNELLNRSNVITLHARATPGTRAMIAGRELDLLPSGAILVNTARAELVDEEALVARLADGRISGAGLDVFSSEPLPPDHPLRTLPTATLTPHLAGSTVEARARAPKLITERLGTLLDRDPAYR